MQKKVKKRRDTPKGNQNDKEQGFYSRVLDETEQMDFELAAGVNGIDDEITLLRVKIKALAEHDPDNIKLYLRATETLASLVKTRYKMTKEQKNGLKDAIGNVLREVVLPLGLGIETVLNKK